MKRGCLWFVCIAAGLMIAAPVAAQVDIGNGFRCEGDAILKGDKEVKYSKARSNTETTIEKLKSKLENAPKKKRKGIKDKLTAAREVKRLLKACSKGQLGDNEVAAIFSQLSSAGGTFTGSYSGTVNGFIPLSGTVTFAFSLNGTDFTTVLILGGPLGNALDAQPLSFTGPVGGIGLPAQFFIPATFIGDVTLSIGADGQLTITNSNSTTGSVTLSSQFSSSAISGNLGGSYEGNTFQGSFNLAR